MTITVAYQEVENQESDDVTKQLVARFAWATGGGLARLTAGPTDDVLIMQMPGNLPIPCLMVAELAWNGEYLVLANINDKTVVRIPNLMPGTVFTKQYR